MLKRGHAKSQSLLDCLRLPCVSDNVGAMLLCCFHCPTDLIVGHLRHIRALSSMSETTGDEDLDVVGASGELFARSTIETIEVLCVGASPSLAVSIRR